MAFDAQNCDIEIAGICRCIRLSNHVDALIVPRLMPTPTRQRDLAVRKSAEQATDRRQTNCASSPHQKSRCPDRRYRRWVIDIRVLQVPATRHFAALSRRFHEGAERLPRSNQCQLPPPPYEMLAYRSVYHRPVKVGGKRAFVGRENLKATTPVDAAASKTWG